MQAVCHLAPPVFAGPVPVPGSAMCQGYAGYAALLKAETNPLHATS